MSRKPSTLGAQGAARIDESAELTAKPYKWRLFFLFLCIAAVSAAALWRIVDLQVVNRHFLQDEGDKRTVRYANIASTRGIISDRNGSPLAVSTPVITVWANPRELINDKARWPELAKSLGMSHDRLAKRINKHAKKGFIYLKRRMTPTAGAAVVDLKVKGVYGIDEFRRYYPAGEVAAHLVGFTNIDEQGQEGMELAYDKWLQGQDGKHRLLKDRRGKLVKSAEVLSSAKPGKDMMLSIDMRIQYLAYRELAKAVKAHKASSGSVVVLDVDSGEILAMVNQPSYNPNNRKKLNIAALRNRAMTDLFEPGSTVKPFTVALALDSGRFNRNSQINTHPGRFRVNKYLTISDHRDYGIINLETLLSKSSNIGAAKLALELGGEALWDAYYKLGFGQDTGTGFPGESAGVMNSRSKWRDVETATLSYGYGVSATPLQLAQAYAVLAADGEKRPLSLLKLTEPVSSDRVMPARTAKEVKRMLASVIAPGGTGTQAAVEGYHVAGKTGTVHRNNRKGYAEDEYMSMFAGMAPRSNPRIVTIVMIDNPSAGEYYGGAVAAPVFSKVASGTLHLLGVAPDNMPKLSAALAKSGGRS